MIDFLYLNGWGPFVVTLVFFLPFLIVFVYVIYRKSRVDPDTGATSRTNLTKLELGFLGVVVVMFFGFNIVSIGYMPTIQTARAALSDKDIQQIDVVARSWSYEFSSRTVEAGRPVRFSGKSEDTMHGFAIYHPNGDVLFTMMLMPGFDGSTSIVYSFDEPGTYTVRCLEYCGIAHHQMRDELLVVAGDG